MNEYNVTKVLLFIIIIAAVTQIFVSDCWVSKSVLWLYVIVNSAFRLGKK